MCHPGPGLKHSGAGRGSQSKVRRDHGNGYELGLRLRYPKMSRGDIIRPAACDVG